jgi:hypothetical protein
MTRPLTGSFAAWPRRSKSISLPLERRWGRGDLEDTEPWEVFQHPNLTSPHLHC